MLQVKTSKNCVNIRTRFLRRRNLTKRRLLKFFFQASNDLFFVTGVPPFYCSSDVVKTVGFIFVTRTRWCSYCGLKYRHINECVMINV